MTESGSLEGFPPEAVSYIKDLRNEAAQYRTERNEVRAKYDEAGDLLKNANTRLADFDKVKSDYEKTLTDNASLEGKFNRLSIAAKYGIPDEADRLKGTTPEELEADAESFAAKLGTKTPGIRRDAAAGGKAPEAVEVDPITEAFRAKGLLS